MSRIWRRHAGTKVDRTVSLDRARQFLHHSPTSDTFRKYYDSGIHDLDVFGIVTDKRQEITTGLDRQTLAAQRIEKRTLDREISIKRFVADSDEVIEAERKVRTSHRPFNSTTTFASPYVELDTTPKDL